MEACLLTTLLYSHFSKLFVRFSGIFVELLQHFLDRFKNWGPGSSVGIANDYGLDGPRSNPGGDEIFRPSRPALGSNHPGSFPGIKCGRDVLLTTHPLLVPRSWKSRAIPLPVLWGHTWPVTGSLYLLPQ